jgi:PAS domain S-box-containing protein
MFSTLARMPRRQILMAALAVTALIAISDSIVDRNIPLGFLYLFPMILVGTVLEQQQIALVAAACTVLTELFDSFEWRSPAALPRNILEFSAFLGTGLLVFESVRSRRLSSRHIEELEREAAARSEAEEQLAVLVESSPAAVLTARPDGRILLANRAAHRLFAVASGELPGSSLYDLLPSLANAPSVDEDRPAIRTSMQCRGRRASGEFFLADVWFSTYRTTTGARIAAMVVDASEDLRNREEHSLNQLLAGSRMLVAAVSHEIRNVCGAIAIAHSNLARTRFAEDQQLVGNRDFEALGNFIGALEKIASTELRHTSGEASPVDLNSLLEELRIVAEPSLADSDIALRWDVTERLPTVWADRQSLMQVFLNLVRNAEAAMRASETRQLTVSASVAARRVTIRIADTGTGVSNPERLFRPFQGQDRSGGLGLFLSRAFMRSFRGDLRHEPTPVGATFVVDLSVCGEPALERMSPQ